MQRKSFLIIAVIFTFLFSTGMMSCGENEETETAQILETSPENGGQLFAESDLIITFDKAVSEVKANGVNGSISDDKVIWAAHWFETGRQTLAIEWVDEDGNAGSEEIALTIQELDTFVCDASSTGQICSDEDCDHGL